MEYPWYQEYDAHVPQTIEQFEYDTLNQIIEKSADQFGAAPAFSNFGTTMGFSQVNALSTAFAAYLQNFVGLRPGEKVAIMMPNLLQYPIALYGILKAGYVVVNTNPQYTARELEHQLVDSDAKAIIILENFATTLQKVITSTNVKTVITTTIGEMLGFPKSLLLNFVIKHVKKMVPPWDIPNTITFSQALKDGAALNFTPPAIKSDDIAFLQYTGGTTGVSKGAILTHRNVAANVQQAKSWCGMNDGEELAISPLPLYHIFSLTVGFFMTSIGGHSVLITNPRDFPAFVKELKKWKFSFISGVNTLFAALLNTPGFDDVDFSRLKISLGGGMAVTHATAEKWIGTTGCVLLEAYGLSETSPAVCINPISLKEYNGFIGVPSPSTDVAILDDSGDEVPTGEAGELCVKGPQVTQGYWQKAEETQALFTKDGWMRTGDIASISQQGYVKILDRKKDMILVSGFNVYPNEVEDIIGMNPKVLEVAVIGLPDETCGERVKAFVVKKDDSLTEEELIAFCKENLTGYKRPREFEFRTELPKTNVGKILRRSLRPD